MNISTLFGLCSRQTGVSEEEDPTDESVEVEGGSSREEKRRTFQHYSAYVPNKQEWRVKEKTSTPTLTTSDDNMDLLDDDEAPLIKDGSPPLTDMNINMVFTLSAKFRGVEEEVIQMCLGPKEVMFKKLEESTQHMKSLYNRGHINGRPISRILIDGGAAINLMPYSIFRKLGREDDELVKTNLTLNDMGGNPMETRGVVSMELTVWSKSLAAAFFIVEVQGNYSVILGRD
jgi:hypothetical protein